jgi:RNA polymerase sigma-70 factor (ECF subfamily)
MKENGREARLNATDMYNYSVIDKTVHRRDPDAELVKRVVTGDEQAFEQMVNKYKHAVFNTIYRYTGCYDDVEDVAQQVFLRVWRYAKTFKGKSTFSTWLYRIVVNQCLKYRKKHSRDPVSLDYMVDSGVVPESLTTREDRRQQDIVRAVKKAIAGLPERQRIAVVLSRYRGMSYKEISEAMKTSVSSVESLIFRAKTTLRKKLAAFKQQRET